MKLHTQDYKTNIKNYGRRLDSKITYTINEVETELSKNQLNSVTPHGEGSILKSTMKQLDIDTNGEIPVGTILNYRFGTKVNGAYEYVNYGNYVVKKVEKQEDTNSYMMTCYDKMLYSMVDYEDMNITYPITIKDYIQEVCDKLGLVFKNANETFPNYNKQIEKELYLDSEGYSLDYTFRDVLDELAQVTASTICINDNDELELRYIKDATYNKTITGKNLFDNSSTPAYLNTTTTQKINTGIRAIDTASSGNNHFALFKVLDVSNYVGKTFSIKMQFQASGTNQGQFVVGLCDENGGNRIASKWGTTSGQEVSFTIPTLTTSNYMAVWLYSNATGTSTANNYVDYTNIMINEGSTALPYESYTNPNITIQDGTETSLVGCNIEGNSYQETYTGKNLAEFDATYQSTDKYTYNSFAENNISVVKTQTGGQFYAAFKLHIPSAGTYRIQGNSSFTISPRQYFYMYSDRLWGTSLGSFNFPNQGDNYYNFTFSSSGTYVLGVYGDTAIDSTFQIKNLMCLRSSETNYDYEPYVGGTTSPNPDYPQEVEVVEGINLVPITTTGTWGNSGITITTNNDGSITLNGTSTAEIYAYINNGYYSTTSSTNNNDITIKAGTTITLKGSYNSNALFRIRNKTKSRNDSSTSNDFTITYNEDTIITPFLYIGNNKTFNNVIFYPQINKGTISLPYVPFNNIGVNVVGKNLLYKVKKVSATTLDFYFDKPSSKTLTFQFYSNVALSSNSLYYRKTGTNDRIVARLTGPANSIISGTFTFTDEEYDGLSQTGNILRVYKSGAVFDEPTIYQLEEGSATEYAPYSSVTTPIDLQGNFIGKIGTIKDELNIDDLGNVILTKRIGKIVFNGSENDWGVSNSGTASWFYRYRYISDRLAQSDTNYLSNYYSYANITSSNTVEGMFITNINEFRVRYGTEDTIANYKTWLSTHNVVVYYVLNTPYQVNLGKAKIELNEGVNYITFLTGLDTRNTIEYGYEKEQIDERFLKDINVDFGKKYGPINSIVLSRSAESDSVYLQDEDSIEANGLCELKIIDNQIMNWQNRSDYLPGILNQLDGLEYYINDYSSTGITYLELCDRYEVKIKDNVYSCIMFNDELDVTTGIQEMIHTDEPKETETDYKKADKTDRKINQAYIIVDKQQNEITAQANRINIIATHIDETTGDVREVTTTTGFTFNADGLNIYKNDTTFNTQINNIGTYYKDGDTILSQTTKDGTKTKDLDVFGYYRYGEDDITDEPMFIAVKYTDNNNEEGYGHFYNG